MTLKDAKALFGVYMKKIREGQTLSDFQQRQLTRARQTMRKHQHSAMNPAREKPAPAPPNKQQAYKGYLIRSNLVGDVWIEKDNHRIAWAESFDQAKVIIDNELQANPAKAPRDASTGKLVIRDKTDRYWFDKGFSDAHLKIRKRNKNQYYLYGYREGKHYIETRSKYGFDNPKRKNPKGAVKIYGRCLRIEAVKTVDHTYGGKETGSGQRYFHDFTSKNAKIYGLPNGDLLISTR